MVVSRYFLVVVASTSVLLLYVIAEFFGFGTASKSDMKFLTKMWVDRGGRKMFSWMALRRAVQMVHRITVIRTKWACDNELFSENNHSTQKSENNHNFALSSFVVIMCSTNFSFHNAHTRRDMEHSKRACLWPSWIFADTKEAVCGDWHLHVLHHMPTMNEETNDTKKHNLWWDRCVP